MKEEKKVKFTQKWIEDAVKKLLQKEDIYESDMEKIKYLRIGEDFNLGYMIQMSTASPPEPFYDTDGGDEWELGGAGGATVTGRFIQLYINYAKKNPSFYYIDSNTGKHSFQLSQFAFWDEFEEEYEELEAEEEGEDWEDTVKKWKAFEKTILCETYTEKFDSDDAYEKWYQQARQSIQRDIGLFTGLEVLRIQGAKFQDMTFLRTMSRLRVWEVVESRFDSLAGIDDLVRLKQLCCWLD
ncbi:MAG: hypothetical protein K2M91_13315 [Lachnospiraceae bacterium]|nr:hypothetical protein [Lachnospiraceae bacterium]